MPGQVTMVFGARQIPLDCSFRRRQRHFSSLPCLGIARRKLPPTLLRHCAFRVVVGQFRRYHEYSDLLRAGVALEPGP